MDGDWLTYEQAAERLGISPQAVRQKAIRGRWQRTIGNDKRAVARLPDGWPNAVRTPSGRANRRAVRTPSVRASDTSLISALQAHVETQKEQLAAAEGRYATAEARVENLVAELADRAAQHADERAVLMAQVAAERANAEKAIQAFRALADRLDALTAANQRQSLLKRLKQRLVG